MSDFIVCQFFFPDAGNDKKVRELLPHTGPMFKIITPKVLLSHLLEGSEIANPVTRFVFPCSRGHSPSGVN